MIITITIVQPESEIWMLAVRSFNAQQKRKQVRSRHKVLEEKRLVRFIIL